MKFRTVTLLALVCALAISMPAMAKNQKPGKWQLTIETNMPNMPMKMQPMTFTHCVTKEQAESNEPPKSPRESSDCKISDMKQDGNTMTWKMSCPKQKITGEGTATYSGDSFVMNTKINMDGNEMSQKMTGKLLGPCD